MAKITTLEAPNLGLQPSEIGVESQAAAGRRLGAFYNQVGQAAERVGEQEGRMAGSAIREAGQAAVDYEQHREISHGAATFAQVTSDLTDAWKAAANGADPNDPSVAAKFRETQLEPALEKFRDAFVTEGGQKWAEGHIDALRSHMFEKTAADMSTLAGEAARVNATQTVNKLSNTVYNDPSSLDFALKTLDTSIGGMIDSSPNLSVSARGAIKQELSEKAREQIVKSAAIGYIEKTGQVPALVTDPAYSKYINGIEIRQFQKAADAQTKANAYYDRQTEVLKKQQADLAVHRGAGDLMANSVTVDPNDPNKILIAPDFMRKALDLARKNPDAPSAAATVRTMIDWSESQHRERSAPIVTDQSTKADLLTRMSDPNKPTSEIDILRAAADGKLSAHDTTIMRELVNAVGPQAMKDPIVHQTLAGAGERVGQHVMDDGQGRYASFLQSFWPEYLRQKNAGTLKPNALDLKDETSLIRQSMKPFEPTPSQMMLARTSKAAAALGVNFEAPVTPTGFVPPPSWQFKRVDNRIQYRDPDGNLYDDKGKPVKVKPAVPISR